MELYEVADTIDVDVQVTVTGFVSVVSLAVDAKVTIIDSAEVSLAVDVVVTIMDCGSDNCCRW